VLTIETTEEVRKNSGSSSRDSEVRELKLLAVSFAYPPMLEPRAVQVSRLLRHLETPSVLVCADVQNSGAATDPIVGGDAESHLERLIRVPFSETKSKKIASILLNKLNAPLWDKSPDPLRAWKWPAVRAVEKLISHDRYRPEVVITFSYPLTDSLIGLELKRLYGVPWIAHFSDPWTDNPSSRLDPISKAVHSRMERMVVEAADRLVFTSEETVDLMMGKYPAELRAKSRVVPHAFEPELYSTNLDHNPKITIRYLGTLYGQRTPGPLFSALERLLVANPDALTDVCFEIVGDTCGLNLEDLGLRKLPKGLVTVTPPVDYLRSLELMVSADGLLVVDAPAAKSVFLPSKLIDYVGAGRPILGITPPGAAAGLIERLGGWIADPSDVEATTCAVKDFLSYLRAQRNRPRGPWGNPVVRNAYEASVVAAKFNEVLAELV
jgi:Glycosyl transferase 4-like domain